MKKIIAGLGILALAFAFTGAAEAALIDDINDDSTASSIMTHLIQVWMNNKNESTIYNSTVAATSNSGGNSFTSSDDQSDTGYETGASSAETGVGNTSNNNELDEKYATYDGAANTIKKVDDNSTATASSSDTLKNEMNNTNNHSVTNKLTADSDSGSNAVSSGDSLSGAMGKTGPSSALLELLQAFNLNLKKIERTK